MPLPRNVFIITDLEGVAGVHRFEQASANSPEIGAARRELTLELNAVVRGIDDLGEGIRVHVWDGHGAGGLLKDGMRHVARYFPPSRVDVPGYFRAERIDALAFVGQHAMSGTPGANLCHTMSHEAIKHYKVNGVEVGEFGLWAAVAGELGVSTIYLAGDDKACTEAARQVPGITTTAVKESKGLEQAVDLPDVEARLHDDIQVALRGAGSVRPFDIGKPVALEIAAYKIRHVGRMIKRGAKPRGLRVAVFRAPSLQEFLARGVI
ncbi:MAG: M55 family metallopeptidase [Candidatus Lokiarchaeota archaeon]|nr:M55 family metallopeptidase [Candidatus Lokiarchaeota archaeon]